MYNRIVKLGSNLTYDNAVESLKNDKDARDALLKIKRDFTK